MPKLTEKQKRFVEEYLIDLNATQAAIRAGYSPKTAEQIGYKLVQKSSVAEEISVAKAERSKRTSISQDRVLEELATIAFANGSDFARVVTKPETDELGRIIIDPNTGEQSMLATVELIPTDQLTDEQKRAISCIKQGKYGIEVNTCDKVKALELLGKHLGMFKEKVEVNGSLQAETSKLDDLIRQITDDG